ncbi:MAG: ATP-binding protein [Actinomycetota bacterium]|nr:ATP-binding protein [Actinomycetota bacterium]
MQTENRPLGDLTGRLKEEPRVWVRLAANRPQDDWQLSLLEVTLGEAPPGWKRQHWSYERAVFAASAPAGTTVARWLDRGRISMRSISLPIAPADHAQVERRQSRFVGIFQALPWPSIVWTVNVRDETTQMVHDELVADDAPAFLTFDLAATAFFGVPPSPSRSFSGREFVVREQDARARIDSVRVRPTEVIVAVSGEQLSSTALTLGGLAGQRKQLRRGTREVHFPLAGGIPSGSWIALHKALELLDRRGLDPAWGQTDVEIEVDPVTEVEVLVSRGEGVSTEFKRDLPTDERDSVVNVMKTVAAFANGEGGTLLFGIDNDGAVVGLGIPDARKTLDRTTQLVRDWVRPHVDFDTELTEVDGKQVLLVRVDAGAEPPHGVGTTDRRIDYYIRRSATSFPATPADVRAFVRARLPTAASPGSFLR